MAGEDFLGAGIGDTLTVELSNGTQKELTISGTAQNAQVPAPRVFNSTYGFISPETARYLGYDGTFTELHIKAVGEDPDEAAVRVVVADVTDQLNRSGRTVYNVTYASEQFTQTLFDTIILMLSAFSWMILFLSGFLVINTISALITQQVQQIGIMKLVGASRLQIAGMYLLLVEVYGAIAFLISLPLTIFTPRFLMRNVVEPVMNIRPESYAIPVWIFLVMILIGALLPLVAGLLPVLQGTRMTTQQALSGVDLSDGAAGTGIFEQVLQRLPKRWVQRPFLLAFRNTLRHKSRLMRTLLVLILGTTLFVAVLGVRKSMTATQQEFTGYHQYDVSVQFSRPYRAGEIEQLALELPEVTAVESWNTNTASRIRPDGEESNRYFVYGLPEETPLVTPVMQEGRWLEPGDTYAVVINVNVQNQEPDIQVGDRITLNMVDREQSWEVVGIVGTDALGPNIYMNAAVYDYETRTVGQANSLQIIATQHDDAFQDELAADLYEYFEAHGYKVSGTTTAAFIRTRPTTMFNIITAFLILMALLLAAVGSLGLSTTMSINMMERIREIGVLRAIGASNAAIRKIVLLEGLVIGVLSWVIGVILSYPTAILIDDALGMSLLKMPLTFQYNYLGAIIWLFALLALAVVASLGPAQKVSKLTIREVLAYE
ncbi:MAG: FtsX-like permease family protein [Chloroflexota bacterium]